MLQLDASDFAALDDTQRAAVLDTMVIGLIADNKVTPPEIRRFDEIVLNLPWGVDRTILTSMVVGARNRLTSFKGPAEIHDYVAGLATKLPTPELRDKVVFTMATLMYSDGEIDQLEKNVLGMFIVAFGITSDRVKAIKDALHGKPAEAAAEPPSSPTTN